MSLLAFAPSATAVISRTTAPVAARNVGAKQSNMLRVLTCGSVDDGKSTLIGRLLWDAGDLPDDTRETIARSAGTDGIPDVSLLLDGLEAERAQGITIDIAWRYVDLEHRRYVVIDCPGHEQYTRNMATGASQADVAIMLVDARQGIKPQTRRHAAILQMVGVRDVVLVVNKMDLVSWSEATFQSIKAEFETLAAQSGFTNAVAIPVAARIGDNVTSSSPNLPWFSGPSLLTVLKSFAGGRDRDALPFRFPVQTVLRDGKDFRGLAGTVVSGRIRVGDEVVEILSGKPSRVARIATFDGDREEAAAGAAVAIELTTDLDIARGGLLCGIDQPPSLARDIAARIAWIADAGPGHGGLLLRTATDLVPVSSFAVISKLDLETMERQPAQTCGTNDIVDARIGLGRTTALDVFGALRATACFVLVDALTGATVAGGVVSSVDPGGRSDKASTFRLTRALLASTVCADLPRATRVGDEFKRRASEVAFLMSAAGVRVDLEAFDEDIGESEGSGI